MLLAAKISAILGLLGFLYAGITTICLFIRNQRESNHSDRQALIQEYEEAQLGTD